MWPQIAAPQLPESQLIISVPLTSLLAWRKSFTPQVSAVAGFFSLNIIIRFIMLQLSPVVCLHNLHAHVCPHTEKKPKDTLKHTSNQPEGPAEVPSSTRLNIYQLQVQAGKTSGSATATLLCRRAVTVSGRRIKATHSWQDTELPNTDPQECEGIHEGHTHTHTHTHTKWSRNQKSLPGKYVCLYTLLLV